MTKLTTTMFISKVLYGFVALTNLSIMLCGEKWVWLNLFAIADWGTAALSSSGIMKRFVNKVEDTSIYEIRVPIVSIGVIRIVQILLTLLFESWTMSVLPFFIVLAFDVVYAGFLMLDNSRYYFELGEDEDE